MDHKVLKEVSQFKEMFIIDLLNYINDVEYVTQTMIDLKQEHLKGLLNLEIPEDMIQTTVNGLSLFYGKETNISDEIRNVIIHIANENYKGEKDKSIYALDCVMSTLKSKPNNDNKDQLYKFLESTHISALIHKIGYILFGDGFHAPPFAIAYMINPEKIMQILSKPHPIHVLEDMIDSDFFDIIEKETKGEIIYKKLNKIISDYNIESYKLTA